MLTATDNECLTRTGMGTPMGAYFRRFWQPVALSEELAEPDSPPVRVRIMGESLVAFRDSDGRVGLIEARCPHRGADLFFGRNEACGLRCVYHGWKFDVSGRAVELPNVPAGAALHDSVRARAYVTREYGDIVWAYLGPTGDTLPEVAQLEFGQVPAAHRYVTKQLMECNWAQVMEGDLDTSHFSFLHMPAPAVPSNDNPHAPADVRRLAWIRDQPMPRFSFQDHEAGFVVGGERSGDAGESYWRMTQYLLPAHGTGPSTLPGETYFGFTLVPISDESCWIYTYAWNPDRPIDAAERDKFVAGHGIIAQLGPGYVPVRNRDNDFQIDREAQRTRSFTGVTGLAEQDSMVQHSQGRIAERSAEHLTATDAAVVRFRRRILTEARALAAGDEPMAPWRHRLYTTRPGSWFAPAGTPFAAVLEARFGDPYGRVAGPARTGEAMPLTPCSSPRTKPAT